MSDRGLEWWDSQGLAAAECWNPLFQFSEAALVTEQGVSACAGVTPAALLSNALKVSVSHLCFGATHSTAAPPLI